jgi:small subunit ribosomal protein S21
VDYRQGCGLGRRERSRDRHAAELSSQRLTHPVAIQNVRAHRVLFFLAQVAQGLDSSDGKEVSRLATVTLRDGESQESLLKRFRKEVMQERILSEARRKRWYISPSEMRRIQKQRAIRRARRRQRQKEARQNYR